MACKYMSGANPATLCDVMRRNHILPGLALDSKANEDRTRRKLTVHEARLAPNKAVSLPGQENTINAVPCATKGHVLQIAWLA